MQFADLGGITLHYDHKPGNGSAPTLVFINSLGTDFRTWDQVKAELGGDFPILCYDKRGHGLSDLGSPPYRIDDHVSDLEALIDHVGASSVVLCGLSVGGLIATGLIARRPELVRALILCDTGHKIGTEDLWNNRIEAIERGGIAAISDAILQRWFTPAFRSSQLEKFAGARNMLIRQPLEGYVGTCAAIRDADHTGIVKTISVPTVCVVGDQDGATPPDLVRAMADLIPDAGYEVIADCGHIPCIEQPDALIALIRNFLAAHRIGAANG